MPTRFLTTSGGETSRALSSEVVLLDDLVMIGRARSAVKGWLSTESKLPDPCDTSLLLEFAPGVAVSPSPIEFESTEESGSRIAREMPRRGCSSRWA